MTEAQQIGQCHSSQTGLHENLLLAFDGILHVMRAVIKAVGNNEAQPWHKHLNKHLGQCKF
jgi:hypothetical protein